MPQTDADLATAAAADPTIARVGGLMCHDTVATWLVQAGFMEGGLFQRQYKEETQPRLLYERLFAKPTDLQVRKEDSASVPAGTICGFYNEADELQHTMVTTRDGVFAGTNNLGVGGGLAYTALQHDALAWNDDGETVGPGRYRMFRCSSEDFKLRYATACAEFAQRTQGSA
jgi:hypothetical protein